MPQRRAKIDGNSVLYSYLEKDLQDSDVWLFQMMVSRLVSDMGIWMHPEIYEHFPLLRPYAIRDPGSRGNRARGIADQWGSPNDSGYFRDDNSLIKGLIKALPVEAPIHTAYKGRTVGNGFTASHVWRRLRKDDRLASRHPLTYSFVPNLVWLPREVAMLTDREGSFVQQFVQATSLRLYRDRRVNSRLTAIVDEAWELLDPPDRVSLAAAPAPDELNFARPTSKWLKARMRDLENVIEGLRLARERRPLERKVVSSRYTQGLPKVAKTRLEQLEGQLTAYRAACLETEVASL